MARVSFCDEFPNLWLHWWTPLELKLAEVDVVASGADQTAPAQAGRTEKVPCGVHVARTIHRDAGGKVLGSSLEGVAPQMGAGRVVLGQKDVLESDGLLNVAPPKLTVLERNVPVTMMFPEASAAIDIPVSVPLPP
jgi:hypothetical protein